MGGGWAGGCRARVPVDCRARMPVDCRARVPDLLGGRRREDAAHQGIRRHRARRLKPPLREMADKNVRPTAEPWVIAMNAGGG